MRREDLKYTRTGYLNQKNLSDYLCKIFVDQFPSSGKLPLHWKYVSHKYFMNTWGHLGIVIWAKASSSHMMFINGYRVLRIWTDQSNSCLVDLEEKIAEQLPDVQKVQPTKNSKCKPFTYRKKVWAAEQMDQIVKVVKTIYGLDS